MRIGINLVGVAYNDGAIGRYRNYEDALEGFMTNVVNPLKEEGHEVVFFIFSYGNKKEADIIQKYTPLRNYVFVPEEANFNIYGGGDRLPNGMKLMSATYLNSLMEVVNKGEDLDLVISTRFDINFFKNTQ